MSLRKLLEEFYLNEICSELQLNSEQIKYYDSEKIFINLLDINDYIDKSSINSSKKKIFRNAEKRVEQYLKSFSCSKEKDVESFLHNSAILFQKANRSRTYLIVSDNSEIIGYFSLAIKTVFLNSFLSNNKRRYANIKKVHIDKLEIMNMFLIGQIGRNDKFSSSDLNLKGFLGYIIPIIDEVKEKIGGSSILIEVKRNSKLVQLYENYGFEFLQEDSALTQLWYLYLSY
ncbi:MAG: hypothetical protein JXR63_11530 [Spirochaetales bacterium]|nr:hypothetical protein [Spirochaetales bacterium]